MIMPTWRHAAICLVSASVTVVTGTNLGDWYFVDVHAVVCPGAPGKTTVDIPIPASQRFDPSIFSFFRTSTQAVTLSFIAKDSIGTVVAQESALVLQPNTVTPSGRRLANSSLEMPSGLLEMESASRVKDEAPVDDDVKARRLSARRRSYSSSRSRSYSGGSYYSPPRRRRRYASYSYSPPRRRRRGSGGSSFSPQRRRRRRGSGGSSFSPQRRRRRRGSGGSSFSPQRRRRRRGSTSFGPPRRRMYPPRRRITTNSATHRRRGSPQSSMTIPRRRYSGYNGGRYSNSHNPNAGYYGYQNQQSAYNNYAPGYPPQQSPYGYHGMAYQPSGGMGTGTKIALAAGGGLLVGGIGGALIANSMHDHHYPNYNQYGSYPQWNGMTDHCTTSQIPGWTGSCQECMSAYPPSSCFSEFHPPTPFYRDDIMGTGFFPGDYTSPIKLEITSIQGADFLPANICGNWIDGQQPTTATSTTSLLGTLPPDGATTTEPFTNATGRRLDFTPPDSQLLFVSLATVGELGDGGGGYPPQQYTTTSNQNGFAAGTLLMLCCCGCCICAVAAAVFKSAQGKSQPHDVEQMPLTPHGPPGGFQGGGFQGGGVGFMSRAPVAPNVAAEFINFLKQEYVYGQEGAVGPFFDSLDGNQADILGPYEDQVRQSPNKQAAIDELERNWS